MGFITYNAAVLFADATFLLVIVALSYYTFINIAKILRQNNASNKSLLIIRNLIPRSRSVHVYAGALAVITATTHAFFLLQFYAFTGIKIHSGVVTLFFLFIVASLGLVLNHAKSNLHIRYRHRMLVIIFLAALLIHRLI